MFEFLTNVVDQLDLAASHVEKGDPTNARIGMMLTDNVLEIVLHRLVQNESDFDRMRYSRRHPAVDEQTFRKALGRNFDDKIRFAAKIGFVDEERARSIRIFHDFRNEVYHVGLQHEPVLPALSRFHLSLVGRTISSFQPNFLSYSNREEVPERARRYFSPPRLPFRHWVVEYAEACNAIADRVGHDTKAFATVLADHMGHVIDRTDGYIETLALEGRTVVSRDDIVRETQAYMIAFSDEGKAYARDHAPRPMSWAEYLAWFGNAYPLPCRRDPISNWRKRHRQIAENRNPHAALERYRTFMTETEQFREWIGEHLTALENWHEEISGRD